MRTHPHLRCYSRCGSNGEHRKRLRGHEKATASETMGFAAFAGQKYLNLETFKRSGQGVKRPVWFAASRR